MTWILVALMLLSNAESMFRAEPRADYARDVQPILQASCVRCHGPRKQEGGLRLDVRRRALLGGDSGPAILPGSENGELLRRLRLDGEGRMPPSGEPLSNEQIAILRDWLRQGARWPDEFAGSEAHEKHWSFGPVHRPEPVAVHPGANVRSAIDAFVVARLKAAGLAMSPEADRETLARRLHLDLLGLPPSPEALERFVRDSDPQAYETLVDRLLSSPHFGERWGRHWLDLARFAESDGYENDRIRKDAWRWRDWVIDAVNRDVPFDRFTVEQLAGDLLPGATIEQKIATGFHRNTLWNSAASGDKEEFRTRAIKDRAETTATAWLGLTLGCAGCHSHKYDPISIREYYQLYAFFNETDHDEIAVPGGKASTLKAVHRPSHVHRRGNFLQPGEAVAAATPAFLPPLKTRGPRADRLDLALWLVDPAHPLTARVAVNHCWQPLFGQALAPTPESVGLNGARPTHPELLDWLAAEFVRLNWSRKALLRTIVLSSTYRQASVHRPDLARVDRDNELLGRQNRFRVEAEIVRDLALSVSGLLDRRLGGPSIVPPFPDGFLDQRFTNEALRMPGPEKHRRGLYIHVQRTLPHPSLAAFDVADGNQPCVRRDRSTTPVQALTMLNDPVFRECAAALGERLRSGGSSESERRRGIAGDLAGPQDRPPRSGDEERIDFAFRLCLGRPPAERERAVLLELISRQKLLGANDSAVWAGVARTLLNLEAFLTRE